MPEHKPARRASDRYERLVPIALVTITAVIIILIAITLIILLGLWPS